MEYKMTLVYIFCGIEVLKYKIVYILNLNKYISKTPLSSKVGCDGCMHFQPLIMSESNGNQRI